MWAGAGSAQNSAPLRTADGQDWAFSLEPVAESLLVLRQHSVV
jgi:hypothetical protein